MHTEGGQRCENCRYWVRSRSPNGYPLAVADRERGYCHARTPEAAGLRWAETRYTDWCGSWATEPPTTPPPPTRMPGDGT